MDREVIQYEKEYIRTYKAAVEKIISEILWKQKMNLNIFGPLSLLLPLSLW